jgi:hypothetical protein
VLSAVSPRHFLSNNRVTFYRLVSTNRAAMLPCSDLHPRNTPCWEAGGSTALVGWRGDRANREIASQHYARTQLFAGAQLYGGSGFREKTLRSEIATAGCRSREIGDMAWEGMRELLRIDLGKPTTRFW